MLQRVSRCEMQVRYSRWSWRQLERMPKIMTWTRTTGYREKVPSTAKLKIIGCRTLIPSRTFMESGTRSYGAVRVDDHISPGFQQ